MRLVRDAAGREVAHLAGSKPLGEIGSELLGLRVVGCDHNDRYAREPAVQPVNERRDQVRPHRCGHERAPAGLGERDGLRVVLEQWEESAKDHRDMRCSRPGAPARLSRSSLGSGAGCFWVS